MKNISTFFATLLAIVIAATNSQIIAVEKLDVRVTENRVIYELFVRNFSSAGNFKAVEKEVPRLAQLGVDVVWLMPIFTPGQTDRWGPFASPYAIKDYKGIDPDYGTAADLHSLVNAIHAYGMEVWLDWVANHTSTDHVWLKSHPDYYTGNGTPIHPNGWNDVYELDYNNRNMRAAMIDAMKYWVTEFDIDGFRCDHTDGVPRDFWAQARKELDAIKPLGWLAESGGDGNNALQVKEVFDYNYAWSYNSNLISIGTSTDVSKLSRISYNLHYGNDAHYYEGKSRMVYLSNHDVVQDNGGTEDRHFGDNLKPMTVLYFTVYGMPLIYNGQEVQYSSGQVLLSQKTPINWNTGHADMTQLITQLCHLKHTEPALRTGKESGSFINHTATNQNVYVYERRRNNYSVVVMLNYGSSQASFNVTSQLPSNKYTEYFTGKEANFAQSKAFTLPSHGYAIYIKDDSEELNMSYTPASSCAIYVDDRTDWPSLTLYGWSDSGKPELYGGWPGASPLGVTSLYGTEWKVFEVPEKSIGETYNLIFSNNGATQINDYKSELTGNIFLTVTRSGVTNQAVTVFADDTQLPIEYFNLQGIKIQNPTNGIFIRRQGSSVTKISCGGK